MLSSPQRYSTAPETPATLLGAEACARGAVEAGAQLATGYPGTPATAAVEYLIAHAPEGVRVEWAVNEKVALEIAAGHSWAGQRSFVAMKMSGLNVASDALLSVATSGTRGGLVVYVADDPGVHYGMVEQDSRLYARMSFLPMVEPGTPQEAKDLCVEAYEVSEAVEAPIMIRGTTATANTLAPVALGIPRRALRRSDVPFDIERYTKAGASRCRAQHEASLARLARAGELLDRCNELSRSPSPCAVIASASVWGYVEEGLSGWKGERPNLLRVVVMNPVPEARIREVLLSCERVLVIEELEPLLEERVRALASTVPGKPVVLGKRDGLLSTVGDLDAERVASALDDLAGTEVHAPSTAQDTPVGAWAPRQLTFCPGCPHRSSYAALEVAIARAGFRKDEVVVAGDIGCTILGMNPPHSLCRTEVAMGSSIALAQGFAYSGLDRPVVAVLGDSTFLHAGIPPLLNASAQGANLTVLVLDNRYTAMTGHQPSLSSGHWFESTSGSVPNPVSIEELVRAARVRRVRKGLPYFTRRLSRTLAQALKNPGVNVVIAEAPCAARLPSRTVIPYAVRGERCEGIESCHPSCLEAVGCPALDLDEDTGKAAVDSSRCMGCGLCATACPAKAIRRDLRGRRRTR